MPQSPIYVLLIEDSTFHQLEIADMLSESIRESFEFLCASSLSEGLSILDDRHVDVVILDLNLPDSAGIETLEKVRENRLFLPVVIYSGIEDEELALSAVTKGAQDYLFKGQIERMLLIRSLRYAIERMRTARSLAENEDRYRALVETTEDGIAVIQGPRLVFCNHQLAGLLGYTTDEIITRHYLDFIHSDDRNRFSRMVDLTTQGSTSPVVMEFRAVTRSGEIFEVEAGASSFMWENTNAVLCSFRDITERRRLEFKLFQADKLESLSIMVSGVAHELKNPLAAIIGAADILLEEERTDDLVDRCCKIFKRESDRCARIIREMQTFATGETQTGFIIDVNDAIDRTLVMWEDTLETKNIRLDLDLSRNIPGASVDPFRFHQVLFVFIKNAVEALEKRKEGTLTIRTSMSDNAIIMEFEDDGPGIPKDHISKLFDPFFTTKSPGKGTGMGLSIAHTIVYEHGGGIDVKSKEGKGTTFTVTLPAVRRFPDIVEKV
ncbi:MAG: PAS domain S-box protein [Deltaproteobacteria bacterium]|nr:PAS domain S-box protein [Candidatus Zymogenaceae bacterium]